VFRQGTKSVEVVQAILILTYWKEAHDNRVWTTVGYAIRICMDLGWHKLEPYRPCDQSTADEIEQRETRNVQRTWLVLFVYDRRSVVPKAIVEGVKLTILQRKPSNWQTLYDRIRWADRIDRSLGE
jgi:hypothetical protein